MRTTLFSLRHLINPLRNTQSRKGLLGHAIKSEKFQREKIEKSTGINGSVLLYDDENSMTPMTDVYFANILDGDEIEKNFNKYQYLFVHYPIYAQDRIFVGTSDEYEKWFINNIRHHETK
jgi:hypothetical protein